MSVSTEGDASSSNNHANRINTQHQNELSVELQDLNLDSDFTSLPTPLILPPADLLDTYETINVLAPLVRCSKLPFRHLCSLYETHITHTPMILAEEFSRAQTARLGDFSTSTEERGVFWMEPRKRVHSHNGALGPGLGRDGEREGKQSSSIVKEHTLRQPSNGDSEVEVELEAEVEHSTRSNHDTEDIYNIRNDPISYCRPAPHRRLPPTPRPPTPNSQLVRGVLLAQFASPNGPSLADAAELIAPYVDGLDLNCGCPQKWAYHEGIGCALLRKPELVRDMVKCVKDRMGWGWPVSIKIRVDPDLA
jgi:tRNA-dihydrouridine synthase 4